MLPTPDLLDLYSNSNRTPPLAVQTPPTPDLFEGYSRLIRRQRLSVQTVSKPDLLDLYSSFIALCTDASEARRD